MAFSTVSVTQQMTPQNLHAYEEDFIMVVQQDIREGKFHEAIAKLLLKLTHLQSTDPICYEPLSHFDQACFANLKGRLKFALYD